MSMGISKPRNQVQCPKCERWILKTNKRHLGNPQCVVTAAENALRDRGLRYVRKNYLTWLLEAQICVEEHPHRVELLTDWETLGRRARSGEKTETTRVVNGNYAPAWVAIVLEAVSRPASQRRKTLHYAAKNPEFAKALEVVRNAVGRAALHDMILFASKQVTEHGNPRIWSNDEDARNP